MFGERIYSPQRAYSTDSIESIFPGVAWRSIRQRIFRPPEWLSVPPIRAFKMHSLASGDPVQTRETDSRCTASSPTTLPMEQAE